MNKVMRMKNQLQMNKIMKMKKKFQEKMKMRKPRKVKIILKSPPDLEEKVRRTKRVTSLTTMVDTMEEADATTDTTLLNGSTDTLFSTMLPQ